MCELPVPWVTSNEIDETKLVALCVLPPRSGCVFVFDAQGLIFSRPYELFGKLNVRWCTLDSLDQAVARVMLHEGKASQGWGRRVSKVGGPCQNVGVNFLLGFGLGAQDILFPIHFFSLQVQALSGRGFPLIRIPARS